VVFFAEIKAMGPGNTKCLVVQTVQEYAEKCRNMQWQGGMQNEK
jgi:hypothetical protein